MKRTSTLAGVKVGTGHPVRIMGVLNVSPESFYKGSIRSGAALAKAVRLINKEGADFIDVGAMSTAPYLKTQITETEEARRLKLAVRIIKANTDLPISIDSFRSAPAEAGLEAGGSIINDITGLSGDPKMGALARHAKGAILMAHPNYLAKGSNLNPTRQIKNILSRILLFSRKNKIPLNRIALDPGIGFFRNTHINWWQWDMDVLRNLKSLTTLSAPLLIGVSRKSFIGHLIGGKPAEDRLAGSLGVTVLTVLSGASIVRTHDVAATKDVLKVIEAI